MGRAGGIRGPQEPGVRSRGADAVVELVLGFDFRACRYLGPVRACGAGADARRSIGDRRLF